MHEFNRNRVIAGTLMGLCLATIPAAAESVLARINDIVLSGQRVTETGAENLRITRRDGMVEPGETGQALYAGDQIETGANAVVVIFFTEEVKTTDKELTIFENSRVTIRGPSSLSLVLGSLFARLRGLFDIEMGDYVLGAQGTEFKVSRDASGRGELRVLEGQVAPLPLMSETPSSGGQTSGAGVLQGSRREFTLRFQLHNSCSEPHQLSIMTPMDPPWIRLVDAPGNLLLMGGESRMVDLRLLAEPEDVEAGNYQGGLVIRCLDCAQEPACRQVTESLFQYQLQVVASPAVQELEKVVFNGGEVPQAQPLVEDETREVLDQADTVFLATRPTYPDQSWPPHYNSGTDRAETYRQARFQAIWEKRPQAWERLGDVYTDWGEDTRAVGAYETQVEMEPGADDDPSWKVKWAESWREIGDLSRADELLRQAEAAGADDAELHLARGNLFSDRANVALDQEDFLPARAWLERAAESFSRAVESPPDARLAGVALTEWSETLIQQAELARREGNTDQARHLLEAAQQRSERAMDAYQNYPYAWISLGKSLRELARVEGSGRNVEPLLGDAESVLRRALQEYPDLAPGYLQLGLVYEVRGPRFRRAAIDSFTRSLKAHPKYAPPYFELGRALETEQPEKASEYFSTYKALERRPFLAGRKAETADRAVMATVPQLQGANLDQARMRLEQANLELGQVHYSPSREGPGTVIEQSRAPGTTVRRGAAVDVTLAAQQGKIRVPNLKGKTRAEAQQLLEQAGLRVGRLRQREKSGQTGLVLEQSPKAGKELDYGTPVDLVVAVPKQRRVKVPKVVGQSESEAVRRLRREGLTVERIDYEPTCERAGVVLNQQPQQGTRVGLPSEVSLLVSAPPDRSVRVPRLVGLHESEARRSLDRNGLRLGRVQSRETPEPQGTVISQSPEAGFTLGVGCSVELVVSTGIQLVEVPNLLGQNLREVQNRFRTWPAFSGLRLGRVRGQPSREAEGTILDQSPRPGAQVRRATAIDLLVAQRPQATVPNLFGYNTGQAKEILANSSLQLGRISQTPTPNARPGTIIGQTPRAGSRVSPGSRVDVVVAAQPQQQLVTVPNVSGRRSSEAKAILERAGLRVSFQGQGEYVSRQTPQAGARVPRGSVVVVVLVIG